MAKKEQVKTIHYALYDIYTQTDTIYKATFLSIKKSFHMHVYSYSQNICSY